MLIGCRPGSSETGWAGATLGHAVRVRRGFAVKRLVEGEVAKFASVEVKPAELAVSSSVPGDKAIEIRLRRSRFLVNEPGFDAGHLRALLAVLESEG
jgi:hypothetical protein